LEKHLKIREFAKLTGVTIKTVLHYHKIGLLAEVKRSAGGYRLYGPTELDRMRSIKRLKYLGLSLEQIKEILGEPDDHKSFREVLLALQTELLTQISTMTERLEKIQSLLSEDQHYLVEDPDESPSFKMFVDILGEDAREQYVSICPEIYEQERKLYGVIDDLQWGLNYQDTLREVAEYFRDHPDKYQQSLDYGPRITAIANISPDSLAITELALEYAQFIMSLPFYEKLLSQESGLEKSLESLWSDMFAEVYSPSQMKMIELLCAYLADGKAVNQ
jgi:DNA-binding transcriptional MerR regulator